MTLNEALRRKIIFHVEETFFPNEVDAAVRNSIDEMLKDYLTSTYGDPFQPAGIRAISADWLCIVPGDGILDPFSVDIPMFRDDFSVPFIKRCPELDVHGGFRKFVVVLDNCPDAGLRDAVEALCSFRREKTRFTCLFNTELRKSASTESFLKKFPQFKAVMAPWAEETVLDLPVTADLDMSALSSTAFGLGA